MGKKDRSRNGVGSPTIVEERRGTSGEAPGKGKKLPFVATAKSEEMPSVTRIYDQQGKRKGKGAAACGKGKGGGIAFDGEREKTREKGRKSLPTLTQEGGKNAGREPRVERKGKGNSLGRGGRKAVQVGGGKGRGKNASPHSAGKKKGGKKMSPEGERPREVPESRKRGKKEKGISEKEEKRKKGISTLRQALCGGKKKKKESSF